MLTTIPPSLGPERKGHTPVDDPGSVHGEPFKRHIEDLFTTLDAQDQKIDDTITAVIGKVNDRETLEEVEKLAYTARDSTNQVIYLLTAEPPMHSDQTVPTLKLKVKNQELKIADIPRIECHGQINYTEPERVTGAIDTHENYVNPTSTPINSYWLHHCPKVSPLVHFHPPQGDPYPIRDTASESDDHNWWQRNNPNRTNEAVFEGNWPHPEDHGERDIYINNRQPHNKSVDAQTSKKTDGHQIVNKMDHSLNNRFRGRHQK
jgi:hypothetical protein